jgi:acetyl esterase
VILPDLRLTMLDRLGQSFKLFAFGGAQVDNRIKARDLVVHAIPTRIYKDEASPCSCLTVFAHGGGFTWGTLDDYDQLCRNIVFGAGGTLVSVDYRLAPAHPFPAAMDDVYTIALWATHQGRDLAAADAPFILAGDSAGGCLAAAVSQRLDKDNGMKPDGQLLIYPMIEHYSATPAAFHKLSQQFRPAFEDIKGAWDSYIDQVTGPSLPFAVPPRAMSLAGLPPALVITAGNDPLRFEGESYADKLATAGVTVTKRCHAGVEHSFLAEPHGSPEVDVAVREIAAWIDALKQGLSTENRTDQTKDGDLGAGAVIEGARRTTPLTSRLHKPFLNRDITESSTTKAARSASTLSRS